MNSGLINDVPDYEYWGFPVYRDFPSKKWQPFHLVNWGFPLHLGGSAQGLCFGFVNHQQPLSFQGLWSICISWNGLPFRGVGGIALFHFLGAFNMLHVHACSILPSQDDSLYIITVCANTKQAPTMLCVILLFITDGLFPITYP